MVALRFILWCVCAFLPFAVLAEEKSSDSLTIYSSAAPGSISPDSYRPVPGGSYAYQNAMTVPGYAVVRHQRPMELEKKVSDVTFADVAAYIDPTTVSFSSLSTPAQTRVLEQNYLFDLVGTDKLLQKYIGKTITVEQIVGDSITPYTGTLMSTSGGLVLQDTDGKILTFNQYSNLRFPELPGGLMTKPTLLWRVETEKPGTQNIRVSYQTSGITWWADYNVLFEDGKDANSGKLDINAWVSIINQSGASYNDASLKLMAGDVQRATPPMMMYRKGAEMAMDMAMAPTPGFTEKSFFEYHLYTLQRPASLPDNSTKQLELFPPALSVPVEKEFVYNGQQDSKVGVYLVFKNDKEHGLGIPLPAGRIRVNKRDDADGSLEFIGEDIIQHTPKDEKVRVKLGNAFDVVGERKMLRSQTDTTRKTSEETIEITLRNHKDAAIKVMVEENLNRYPSWEIRNPSHTFEKKDAYTVQFPLTLPKNGETKITYTVIYRW